MRGCLIALILMAVLVYEGWSADAPVKSATDPIYNVNIAQLFGGHP